jgi:gamma-glutamyltranspeptidase/glutathione hydrolase
MIAASAVLTVVLPHVTSLGGCGMVLLHDASSGRTRALNGSGIAPGRATPTLFGDAVDARGPRSWVVPGLVRLWAQAHRAHGRRPWAALFRHAIELAADGAAFSSEVARNLAIAVHQVRGQPGFTQAFQVDGHDRQAGTPWVQAALAQTLQRIASNGEDGFYEGPVAQALCRFASENGGLLSTDDLRQVAADWAEPVLQGFGSMHVAVMPPNSVGVLMLAQLARLQQSAGAPRAQRLYTQVMNARACLPLLHDRVADGAARWPWHEDGAAPVRPCATGGEPGDTAGIVLADSAGNGLAMLQSVFQPFGSGCVEPATGILMNNRLSEFSIDPGRFNVLSPGRRPVHTLNPYMAFLDGKPALYAVSPGGVSQTTTGVQCLDNVIAERIPLQQAIHLPRWSIGRDGQIMCEHGFPDEAIALLRDSGLSVVENSTHPFYFGSIKAVRMHGGHMLEAAADLRRQAYAAAW